MGRSFWFECTRCGCRATVSGGADRGLNFSVQTVSCADCKRLYDAVTRLKVPMRAVPGIDGKLMGLNKRRPVGKAASPGPPSFESASGLLLCRGIRNFTWERYKLQCPVSPLHRVTAWNFPGKCPKCGLPMDRTVLPYRLWD